MSLKIYSYPKNFRVAKAQIAAAIAGFEIETPAFKFPDDNHSAEFKAKHNPLGKVPVLETPHGSLFESNAILRYVARVRSDNTLYGANFWEAAQVDQWLDFGSNELEPARAVWMYPLWEILTYDEDAYLQAKKDVEKALSVLDAHLLRRTFLVGNGITIADLSIVCALSGMFAEVFDESFRSKFPNVQRWFETVANQPEAVKFLGPVTLAKSEKKAKAESAGHKKAGGGAANAAAGGADEKKKDKKDKKADKPDFAAADKPKGGDDKKKADKADGAKKDGADKKKGGDDKKKGGDDKKGKGKDDKKGAKADASPKVTAAKPPAEKETGKSNLDLLDELEKPAKKAKNPLDDLPESAMVLDSVKKLFFSQKPFNPNFWAEFWPKYDAAGYSLWTIKYKYDAENTVYFKACNTVGGYIQRCDDCRKYAFGVVNMVGVDDETPPFKLNGAWLFRGPAIIGEMKAVDDSEYFEWTKVDAAKPEGRAVIEKMFTGASPAESAGDKLLERRYFK
jgi:glutathione S-transferase